MQRETVDLTQIACEQPEGRFSKLGLDLELDDDFQVDVGVELDGLALPGEVKLDFLYRKSSSNRVDH